MTLSPETEAEIRRLFFAEHWKVGTIEAQLGIHHDGVLRVTGLTSPRRVVPANARESGVAKLRVFRACPVTRTVELNRFVESAI